MWRVLCLIEFVNIGFGISPGLAQQDVASKDESPWMLVPTLSSDPKLGTSVGVMAAYLYKFDPESTQSMFAFSSSYSDNDSRVSGLFGQMFFDSDRQKLLLGIAQGKINNDYDDFLGSGIPAQTTDQLEAIFARYSHVVSGDWYAGFQLVSTNYAIGAEGFLDPFLDLIGLTGFDSVGAGLVGEYDSRDNVRNPTEGRKFTIHNIAYRESLGGDESFDVYSIEYNEYKRIKKSHVLAWQVKGRLTEDAPIGGYSSVELRGYVRGNFLAPNYAQVQLEDRFSFNSEWGMSVFGGVGCLFDQFSDCDDSDALYPSVGVGAIYTLKPEAGIVMRAEIAVGESEEYVGYISFGNPF
jgi:outer membrane protein assembly factor BamA